MLKDTENIGILGGGSWGTALAVLLDKKGHKISVWEPIKEHIEIVKQYQENRKFLPGVTIPPNIEFTSQLREALDRSQLVVIALPSHVIRKVLKRIKEEIDYKGKFFVSASKGLELETAKRISNIMEEELPDLNGKFGVISGPSHAEEVGKGIPTSVVVSAKDESLAKLIQKVFMHPSFRVYINSDIIGVELGGSLKNIIAIAAGICDGLGFGDNTKSALITRGLAEITRLGIAMGAKPQTFAGLSGMGDLIATCFSRHSRNRNLGEKIGRGKTLKEALEEMVMVAEGVNTSKAAIKLAKVFSVELPITVEVCKVLFEGKSPFSAVEDLMCREPKPEFYPV